MKEILTDRDRKVHRIPALCRGPNCIYSARMSSPARAFRILPLAVAAAFLFACPAPAVPRVAEHVILFIGDGMQMEHEVAASRYLYGTDLGLSWHGFPVNAYVATWDVTTYDAYASDAGKAPFDDTGFDPLLGYDPASGRGGAAPFPLSLEGTAYYFLRAATDSAAAATAMSTGFKTDAGNIAWKRGDPAGGALSTIAEILRARRGSAIGVVTTVPFDHATPACFVSHNVSRGNSLAIADEITGAVRPDVVIGGGHPGWFPGYFTADRLAALKADAGYVVVERVAGQDGGASLRAAASALPEGRKLFGLFGGAASGDFEPPVPRNDPGNPGFATVGENPSLADMVDAALAVLDRNPNGFFLMAEEGDIDHSNHANDYAMMIGTMWGLDQAVKAALAFVERPGDGMTWENTLLVVTADHGNSLMRLSAQNVLGAGALPAQAGGEVTYGTTGHTNELVTLSAKGAGAALFSDRAGREYPGTAIIDNTDVFLVLEAAGLGN